MNPLVLVISLLAISFTSSFGQAATDSITIKQAFGGYKFYQGQKRLNMNQLANAMKPNEQAYQQIKSAQTTYTLATVIGGVGGFMVGWPMGAALAGGQPNWAMAGIGAGLIVVSIPITKSFNNKARQAVDTFNSGLRPVSFWDKNELKFSMTGQGAGLLFKF
jgi:hypothetical protein